MRRIFRHHPQQIRAYPPGIPFIIVNEAAERFSYYGMRAILVIFMTRYLTNADGRLDTMPEQEAQGYFHLFASAVYFTPLLGALISDGWLGKYKTIIWLSLIYCLGHFALALDHTRAGLLIGQSLIALGAGGIKPCVSAHLGDQFGTDNRHLLGKVYSWFYFSINFGAFAAMIMIPWLLEYYGAAWGFGVPGVVMLLATLVFWSGRYQFVHIRPQGTAAIRLTLSRSGLANLAKLAAIYAFVTIFWALFEQTGSSWVLQAQKMDRVVFGIELLPSQIQAANPLLIMMLTPLFTYWLYPKVNKLCTLTELRKMTIGMSLTVIAFAIPSLIQMQLDTGNTPSIAWQLIAYVILTSAEVMVSITCLEFSYRFAPANIKSLVMAVYLLSISLGNLLTSAINFATMSSEIGHRLVGAQYFWFFTGLMLATTLLFIPVSKRLYQTNSLAE